MDAARQVPDDSSSDCVSVHSSITWSTELRGKYKDKRIKMEKKLPLQQDLTIYREEPVLPADSLRWVRNAQKLLTIQLDSEMRENMVEPCGIGLVLR